MPLANFLQSRFVARRPRPRALTRSSLKAYSAPLSPFSLRCRHKYEPGEYIAVVNGGAIRAGLDIGPVYTENVRAVLPFKNEVRYCFVHGTVIKQMLEHSVRNDGPSMT